MKQFFKNYLSTISLIIGTYIFYSQIGYYQDFFSGKYGIIGLSYISFTFGSIFLGVVILYSIFLIPFYIFHTEDSKAVVVYSYIYKNITSLGRIWTKEEKIAVLAWGVKIFFAPLMIFWAINNLTDIINISIIAYKSGTSSLLDFYNTHLFWILFKSILFIDVTLFTLGYLIESKYLGNTIRSVEPTILGWVVALICYPPLNEYTGNYLGWYSQDFPKFENISIHIGVSILLLVSFCIYSWASIALGWKASNLTHRGIVTSGPYRYVRHPAYIAKNFAWFLGSIPAIISFWGVSDYGGIGLVIFSIVSWGAIYFLRAWTEEKHLMQDRDYKEYTKQVPYRFIPKLY